MSEKTDAIRTIAQECVSDETLLNKNAADLGGSSRRARQQAASVFAELSKFNPKVMAPFVADLVDALNRPEAQTRWESLEALARMVPVDSRACDKGIEGADAALFDEGNDLLHLAAMRFLCALGATTEKRCEKVWPLIDEGIQCYHGDPAYQDMLVAIIEFSKGKLTFEARAGLLERMAFDAEHASGALGVRALQISENVVESAMNEHAPESLHHAALAFACSYGKGSEKRCERMWPYVRKYLDVCANDAMFAEDLAEVLSFAKGKITAEAREELAAAIDPLRSSEDEDVKSAAESILKKVQ